MACSCKSGILYQNPQVQDLNDGTMIRGLSPLPGPIGVSRPTTTTTSAHLSKDLEQRFLNAPNYGELHRIAVELFGPSCFSVGVIVGIGDDIFDDAKSLLKLVWTLVLADLYDIRNNQDWWKFIDLTNVARLLMAKLVSEEELRRAAEERDALIKELTNALKDPFDTFKKITSSMAEALQNDWKEFNKHMNAGTLEGHFKAGMIFGKVLYDVFGLITGIAGAAKVSVKLAKLPRLAKYAKSLKCKRGMRKMPGSDDIRRTKRVQANPKPSSSKPSSDPKVESSKSQKEKSKAAQEESVEKPVYKNKKFPTKTKPSGERGGKPFGERTTNKSNASPEYKRSIRRENEAADLLANEGYKVEQNPVVKGPKDPDYRIEGEIFDCYAPKTDNPRSIVTHIADEKIGKKQTERIVLNLADSDVERHALRQTLKNAPIDGLKEIIIIDKDKNIINFFP